MNRRMPRLHWESSGHAAIRASADARLSAAYDPVESWAVEPAILYRPYVRWTAERPQPYSLSAPMFSPANTQ